MSITDELRKWAKGSTLSSWTAEHLTAIADRIDAEHERECHEQYACGAEHGIGVSIEASMIQDRGYIELPKDADGELVDIGDLVDEMLPFGGYAKPARVDTMELYRSANGYGWMVKLDAENRALISPKLLRHHKQPTVEDVLREFGEKYCDTVDGCAEESELFAEYAAKLQLKETE